MFKSLEPVITNQPFPNSFKINDYNFEIEVPIPKHDVFMTSSCTLNMVVAANVYAHKKLNLIKNIYLINKFLIETQYTSSDFEYISYIQNNQVDKYCPIPGINFSKDIYPKLIEMHKELSVFK